MEKLTTVTGKLLGKKRLNSSYYGNPNWEVLIEVDGINTSYKTRNNASVGYVVSNYSDGLLVELQISKHNRIVFMQEVKQPDEN